MLCQFKFKNFKSYKDETIFDMQATTCKEFADSLLSEKGVSSDLLPVCAIYGPNGGGKSNLLQALVCLISSVVKPLILLNQEKVLPWQLYHAGCAPFAFDETSKKEPTEFEVFFRTEGYEYRYQLSVFNGVVVFESLYRKKYGGKKPTFLFEREKDNIRLGASINKAKLNTVVNNKMPYLSFLAINYNLPSINLAANWFYSCVIKNYTDPISELSFSLPDNQDFKKNIIKMLNNLAINISDFHFQKAEDNEKAFKLFVNRLINGKKYELDITEESGGTQKLFFALPLIILALNEGRLFIADELDAKLHPKLLRAIIMLFKNPKINTKGAQLLFTSQDLSTMNNDVFRRDEIWFACRKEDESSDLYSLYDIQNENTTRVNATAAFNKQYLEGRYGADPYLKQMLDWGE